MSVRSPRVLVVDDEADLRELLELTLVKMGLDVDSAATVAEARALLARHPYQLVLTDMRLPDGLGLELVRDVATTYKNTPIAVVTAFGSADNAVVALKAGAFDYIAKPVALDQLRLLVRSALRVHETAPGVHSNGPADAEAVDGRLKGGSAVMAALRAQIGRLARSMAPIAIHGESGSGKELAAREIHARSPRAGQPFIAVNCGAIPEALMEAEFFGYRKGAFTGAADDRDGFFQAANGGTLLLAIQERRVRKIGATSEEPVDVRLISATHKNLARCVEQGAFRQDLFYRLNVIELAVPPLRERQGDLPALADAILERLGGGGHNAALGPGVLEALAGYRFPGNVRELENILERALAFANDGVIEVADLALKAGQGSQGGDGVAAAASPASSSPASSPDLPASLPDYLSAIERDIILRALAQTQFNRTQAAQLLGISFRQLRYQMQKLNIQEPEA